MVPGTVVLICEPCLAFLRTSSGSYRTGIPGRMALVGSECAGWRRAVSRILTSLGQRDTGSKSEVGLGAGLLIREAVQRHAGALPYGSFSDPYNTVCVRTASEYCSAQGMVPGSVVLTCEPCFAFLRMFSSSYRAGVPGRMALVGSECAGRRRAVSRVPTSPGHGIGVTGSE